MGTHKIDPAKVPFDDGSIFAPLRDAELPGQIRRIVLKYISLMLKMQAGYPEQGKLGMQFLLGVNRDMSDLVSSGKIQQWWKDDTPTSFTIYYARTDGKVEKVITSWE